MESCFVKVCKFSAKSPTFPCHCSTKFVLMRIVVVFLSLILGSCATGKTKVFPLDTAIVPRSGWNANEPRPYKQHVPVRITIHHEGTRLEDTANAAKKIRNIQIWGMGKDRN